MPQAIIVRDARYRDRLVGMHASPERDGNADEHSAEAKGAIAIEGCLGCHCLILVTPQSVIKP